jgi:hypothetical protein
MNEDQIFSQGDTVKTDTAIATTSGAVRLPETHDASTILAEHATEIRALSKRAIGSIIEIGRRLIEAKALAGHGNWLPWLEREFGWKEQTARNFMNVAGRFKSTKIGDLDINLTALYLLAAPSTPTEVVEEVMARASASEAITKEDVAQTTSAHKTPPLENLASPQINAGRRRALPPPAAPSKAKAVKASSVDPVIKVADSIVEKCGDGGWRSARKIASIVQFAETAVSGALKSLDSRSRVEKRKPVDGAWVYRVKGEGEHQVKAEGKSGESPSTLLLATKDAEIVALKARVADLEAEVTRLKALLCAPSEAGIGTGLAQAAE